MTKYHQSFIVYSGGIASVLLTAGAVCHDSSSPFKNGNVWPGGYEVVLIFQIVPNTILFVLQ